MSGYLKMYRWDSRVFTALVIAPSVGEAWCVLKSTDLMAYAYAYSGNYLPLTWPQFDEHLAEGWLTIKKSFPIQPRELSLGFCTDRMPERSSLWRENGHTDPTRREFYGEVFWK